jgi:VanZ family protein
MSIRDRIAWKLVAAAAWGCFIFVIYATLSSLSERPELASSETVLSVIVERVGAYALLGGLFKLAYPRRFMLVCLLVLGSAIALESLQNLVPGRDARIVDALEKLAGGIVGIGSAAILAHHSLRRTQT